MITRKERASEHGSRWPQHSHFTETGAKPPAFQNRLTCNGILLHVRRQTASHTPYGSVEVKPALSQCPGLNDFRKLLGL